MRKETAKDIAIALIARSGSVFDSLAFESSDISEKEKQKILDEVQVYCQSLISKIEHKYNIEIPFETSDIVDAIVFD